MGRNKKCKIILRMMHVFLGSPYFNISSCFFCNLNIDSFIVFSRSKVHYLNDVINNESTIFLKISGNKSCISFFYKIQNLIKYLGTYYYRT
jgi:hypothetical protein